MLRWTNRLQRYLESRGQGLWFHKSYFRQGRYVDHEIVEAELLPQSRSQITNCFELHRLFRQYSSRYVDREQPEVRTVPHAAVRMGGNPGWENNVKILWLSETVFLIEVGFIWNDDSLQDTLQFLYSIEFTGQRGWNDRLVCYRLVEEGPADPETWLGFLAPLIPPTMTGDEPEVVVIFGTAPGVDAAGQPGK
jgi:hypothetical protein